MPSEHKNSQIMIIIYIYTYVLYVHEKERRKIKISIGSRRIINYREVSPNRSVSDGRIIYDISSSIRILYDWNLAGSPTMKTIQLGQKRM